MSRDWRPIVVAFWLSRVWLPCPSLPMLVRSRLTPDHRLNWKDSSTKFCQLPPGGVGKIYLELGILLCGRSCILKEGSRRVFRGQGDGAVGATPTACLLKSAGWNPRLMRRGKWWTLLSRRQLSCFCRFVSGHFACKAYLRRFCLAEINDLSCRMCGEDAEHRDHFLSCPACADLRARHWGSSPPKWPTVLNSPRQRKCLADFATSLLGRLQAILVG